MVNFVSKRPTVERLNRLTVGNTGGSNYYAHGDFGGPIDRNGKFGYRVNVVEQGGETAVENMKVEKTFFSAAFDWNISERLLVQFDGSYRDANYTGQQSNFSFASGVERLPASRFDTSRSYGQPWTRKARETTRYGARLRWEASDALTLRTAVARSGTISTTHTQSSTVQADGTYRQSIGNVFPQGGFSGNIETIDTRGQAFADFRFQIGSLAHKLTAGVLLNENRQERFNNPFQPAVVYEGLSVDEPTYFPRPEPAGQVRGPRIKLMKNTSTTWSIGDDITFNEQWSLLAGIAHTTIDNEPRPDSLIFPPADGYEDSAVTPTLSLIYKPAPWLTTYATYIESLEQGGTAGDEFNGSPVTNAGDVFEPLMSEQIEVGVKASVKGVLLAVAAFEIDKGLQFYDVTDPARPTYVQDGQQVHRGLEFTATGKATEHLTLIGGFTVLDAKVKDQKQTPALEGKRPAVVSEKFAKLRAEYRVHGLPALTLIAGANYTGEFFADAQNTDRLPSYTVYDLGARYLVGFGDIPLTLRLEARNLRDEHYWVQANTLSDPRTVVFSVSADF